MKFIQTSLVGFILIMIQSCSTIYAGAKMKESALFHTTLNNEGVQNQIQVSGTYDKTPTQQKTEILPPEQFYEYSNYDTTKYSRERTYSTIPFDIQLTYQHASKSRPIFMINGAQAFASSSSFGLGYRIGIGGVYDEFSSNVVAKVGLLKNLDYKEYMYEKTYRNSQYVVDTLSEKGINQMWTGFEIHNSYEFEENSRLKLDFSHNITSGSGEFLPADESNIISTGLSYGREIQFEVNLWKGWFFNEILGHKQRYGASVGIVFQFGLAQKITPELELSPRDISDANHTLQN